MKPKNVMLLGFINRAVEYLDNHMDEQPDSRLAELKNIDLASLRDELIDNLDTSLGTMQSTMTTLLKAGNEAFDQFVEDSKGKLTIADEFDRLFDVDLDGARKNKQEQLAKLLSFYSLDSDFEENETVLPNANRATTKETKSEDDEYLQEIMKNASNDDDISGISENIRKDEIKELDNVFSEIVSNEKLSDKVNEKDPKYVNGLINDLKQQLKKEENTYRQEKTDNKDVYERITKLYPHLSNSFIRVVYDLKSDISKEYPINKKVIVLHRTTFKDVDNLRKFVEICINHDYQINADEDKMIVDVFKEFINGDGKILANIFEVANQGSLLGGTYEGYNAIINEE